MSDAERETIREVRYVSWGSPVFWGVVLVLIGLAALLPQDFSGFGFFGVDRVRGSGNLVTETRDVGSFTRIDVRGGANVELRVDPSVLQSVSVTYDDNVVDFIVTEVDGNTLVIDTRGLFSTTGGPRRLVTVITDRIDEITTRNGADVTGNGVTESYRLRVSQTDDAQEGARAFLEKREPRWRAR